MMRIHGIEGLTLEEIHREIAQGARFVFFRYCVSVLVLTFQRPSDIYFVRGHESALVKGAGFSALTALLGWWGIPWGPIYSCGALATNFRGGQDITNEVLCDLAHQPDVAPHPRASVTIESTADTLA
jgi:hypothetical protein